jgi:hypothetical protein
MTPAETLADAAWRQCWNTHERALCLACVIALVERLMGGDRGR